MSNGKVMITRRTHRGMVTAMKVLALVALSWGVAFPALFWSLNRLIN
ncbi:hypothetical protein SNE35_29045 [Paucibacter sp. R3-3]|uniref:Uncharacterized protein n=1 Tax=Roseateles agri TaxID=3098619 RepID=A0ABU5DQI5_9BURK|nr:hypothetical protein [Paucibacter sp. R3-3]MDY0748580.1 hypothetical protein [Paucibacter sp. R3-3]